MKFKPKIDAYFIVPFCIATIILLIPTILGFVFNNIAQGIFTICILLFVDYLLLSPLFGFVQFEEKNLYIKYGLIIKKRIPYDKISTIKIEKKLYSECLLSLKTSVEHMHITYNLYDTTCISLKETDAFLEEVARRMEKEN